ncbi:MAG: hypothetical protein ABUM51_02995 [Bacteroidota bacterium]
MSIFPKRTIRGATVTIHWNFNTAHLRDVSICPFVRIGVIAPNGAITMLLEKYMLALPAIREESPAAPDKFLYLNKNTPLLVLAGYLSGRQKKEVLVDILQNLQSGRHYYFPYFIPADAPLGKYRLLSEVYSEGGIRLSRTAADDFFLVESIEVEPVMGLPGEHRFRILNHSPEPTPVKLLHYQPGSPLTPDQVDAFEMPANGIRELSTSSSHGYLSYNEERQLLPLVDGYASHCIRSQQYLVLVKNAGKEVHLLHPETEESFTLSPEQAAIWGLADGIHTREEVRTAENAAQYDELLANRLIEEIPGKQKENQPQSANS